MATKADAIRWLESRLGSEIDTTWVRPSGMTTTAEGRTLSRNGRIFRLGASRAVNIRDRNTVVNTVSPDKIVLEMLDGDGVTWQWVTYAIAR